MARRHEGMARLLAGVIALLALAGLAAQFAAQLEQGQSADHVLLSMSRFFTNVGNSLVALVFGRIAWAGRAAVPASLVGLATCAEALVGIAFSLLLRGLHQPSGLQLLSSHLLHDLVPPLTALWWVALGRRGRLTKADPWRWLLLPLAYGMVAEVRGAIEGTYPYFFLNPVKIGWLNVLGWLLALGAGFVAAGLAMVRLDRSARD